jgi:hypothetical protein
MTILHRCPSCHIAPCDTFTQGDEVICACCDEVAARYYPCDICGERECHPGLDECLECCVDSVIADPRELDQCTPALQLEIARVMAERLRPFMRQRQAA